MKKLGADFYYDENFICLPREYLPLTNGRVRYEGHGQKGRL